MVGGIHSAADMAYHSHLSNSGGQVLNEAASHSFSTSPSIPFPPRYPEERSDSVVSGHVTAFLVAGRGCWCITTMAIVHIIDFVFNIRYSEHLTGALHPYQPEKPHLTPVG